MPRLFRLCLAASLAWTTALPLQAQSWTTFETAGLGTNEAVFCADPYASLEDAFCFRLMCFDGKPLHFGLLTRLIGEVPEGLAVSVAVDGQVAGVLDFAPTEQIGDDLGLAAAFDPRLHPDLIGRLRAGNSAELALGWDSGVVRLPMGLAGSNRALGAVMETCPVPQVPVDDPGAQVLAEVTEACRGLGGSVEVEPGFERREDLDSDGRDDVVIDYAAAVCSEMASLYCGTGGCTVAVYLARGDGFARIFADVIRGYDVLPGGYLALDLHGSACGLYGFEACRRVFDIRGDAPVLVEELGGPAAEAAMAAGVGARVATGATGETAETEAGAAGTLIPTGEAAGTADAGGATGTAIPRGEAAGAPGTDAADTTGAAGETAETEAGTAGTLIPTGEAAGAADAGGATGTVPTGPAGALGRAGGGAPAGAGATITFIPTGEAGSGGGAGSAIPPAVVADPTLPAELVANPGYGGGRAAATGPGVLADGGKATLVPAPSLGGGLTGGTIAPSPRHGLRPGVGWVGERPADGGGGAPGARVEETAQE